MGLIDSLRNTAWTFLLGTDISAQGPGAQAEQQRYEMLRSYQRGNQARQIKVKPLQADDNVTINYMGLIVERSISMLFGQGIEFDLPGEEETEQDRIIGSIWEASRQAILLHRLAQLGGVYGTVYLKILPVQDPPPGKPQWRLTSLNPRWMRISTASHDMDQVLAYEQRYVTFNGEAEMGQSITQVGDTVAHKIVTEAVKASELTAEGNIYQTDEVVAWQETHYVLEKGTGYRWAQLGAVVDWPWPFSPILSWQNLPDAESPYGLSDLEDVIGLQDRYNFIQSNNSKIVRYHAHPRTWGRGSLGSNASWGADEIIWLQGDTSQVANLEMHSDLKSSVELATAMRQDLFDISRTVDATLVHTRLASALTNFGLRVLYKDALDKNYTKRELYGEALLETNRRLLMLSGYVDDAAEPGDIVWPDPLPVEELNQAQVLTQDLANGLVSKQTASGTRGYDWTEETDRIDAEKQASADLGASVLRDFMKGRGVVMPPNASPGTPGSGADITQPAGGMGPGMSGGKMGAK
jgi:Phage portal protein, SPP1 Gp6-like